MDNIYLPQETRLLRTVKHTPLEWSFFFDFKTAEEPGKFVMISLPNAGEVPISISGFSPDGIELTIRKAGKVTSRLFQLKPGGIFYVRGPYGNIFPVKEFHLQHLLIIAGGSGVAAIKSVVEYFINGEKCELKELDILLGFKSPRQLLFKDQLREWKKKGKDCRVLITVDTHAEEEEWEGKVGFVTEFIKEVKNIGPETNVIVVGPPLMMINTIKKLFQHGVRGKNIWLSFERHMKCGVGKCGHCRIRDKYVCVDGPVFNYLEVRDLVD